MYDIYLSTGCRSLPDLNNFAKQIPAVLEDKFLVRLMMAAPGFLGFDLPIETAKSLMRWLRDSKARALGCIVPTKYRTQHPRFTVEMAFPIAEQALKQEQLKHPGVEFDSEVHFSSEDLMGFIFGVGAEAWRQKGMTPAGLMVAVDKLDGHVWQDEEFILLSPDR